MLLEIWLRGCQHCFNIETTLKFHHCNRDVSTSKHHQNFNQFSAWKPWRCFNFWDNIRIPSLKFAWNLLLLQYQHFNIGILTFIQHWNNVRILILIFGWNPDTVSTSAFQQNINFTCWFNVDSTMRQFQDFNTKIRLKSWCWNNVRISTYKQPLDGMAKGNFFFYNLLDFCQYSENYDKRLSITLFLKFITFNVACKFSRKFPICCEKKYSYNWNINEHCNP